MQNLCWNDLGYVENFYIISYCLNVCIHGKFKSELYLKASYFHKRSCDMIYVPSSFILKQKCSWKILEWLSNILSLAKSPFGKGFLKIPMTRDIKRHPNQMNSVWIRWQIYDLFTLYMTLIRNVILSCLMDNNTFWFSDIFWHFHDTCKDSFFIYIHSQSNWFQVRWLLQLGKKWSLGCDFLCMHALREWCIIFKLE